jgi:hypothetical protein
MTLEPSSKDRFGAALTTYQDRLSEARDGFGMQYDRAKRRSLRLLWVGGQGMETAKRSASVFSERGTWTVLPSGRGMLTLMIIMDARSPRAPRSDPADLVPALREVQVGFRVRRADSEYLSRLASRAGVGPMTLARLVVEKYLTDQRLKESSK